MRTHARGTAVRGRLITTGERNGRGKRFLATNSAKRFQRNKSVEINQRPNSTPTAPPSGNGLYGKQSKLFYARLRQRDQSRG